MDAMALFLAEYYHYVSSLPANSILAYLSNAMHSMKTVAKWIKNDYPRICEEVKRPQAQVLRERGLSFIRRPLNRHGNLASLPAPFKISERSSLAHQWPRKIDSDVRRESRQKIGASSQGG